MDIKVIYDAYHPDLQDCPAGCDRYNGTIVINPDLFYVLTPFQQKFILLHEEGHINQNTDDEISADAYAFDYLVNSEPYSMKQMIAYLNELLIPTAYNARRKNALLQRAYKWDATH